MMKNPISNTFATRRGFTLVELLVVVMIIAVLVALSILAIGKIRTRAEVANAINSLRQIGTAQVAYASENHGAINTLRLTEDEEDAEMGDTFWFRMQPYLFSGISSDDPEDAKGQLELAINNLFNTPNAKTMVGTPFSGIPEYLDSAGLPMPIGFNENLHAPDGPDVRMSSLGDPSRVIYTSYGNEFFDSSHGAEFRPMPQNGGPSGPGIYYLEDRKAIVCFLDGHVETLAPPIPERRFK